LKLWTVGDNPPSTQHTSSTVDQLPFGLRIGFPVNPRADSLDSARFRLSRYLCSFPLSEHSLRRMTSLPV